MIPSNVFPKTKYTHANFSRTWSWLKRNYRIYGLQLENPGTEDVFCPYLGAYGITIPAGETVSAQFRIKMPYTKAVRYYNTMRDHLSGETPKLKLAE